MLDINHLYNAGSIAQDISNLSVLMFRAGTQVYQRALSNCRIENQTLFADNIFDVPERFDALRIMSGNDTVLDVQTIKINTEHTDGDKYMVLWNNNGICKI